MKKKKTKKKITKKPTARKARSKSPARGKTARRPKPKATAAKRSAPRSARKKSSAKKRSAPRPMARRTPPAPARSQPQEAPAKFTPSELAEIRAALKAKREELYAAYRQSKRLSFEQSDSDGTHDSGDVASNTYTREFLLTLNDNEQRLLKQIDEALERLDRRKYGLCASCRSPIAAKRLKWIPWATLCVVCQLNSEGAAS